jgi:hypothetical protein
VGNAISLINMNATDKTPIIHTNDGALMGSHSLTDAGMNPNGKLGSQNDCILLSGIK